MSSCPWLQPVTPELFFILPLLRTACDVAWKLSSVLGFPFRLLGGVSTAKAQWDL